MEWWMQYPSGYGPVVFGSIQNRPVYYLKDFSMRKIFIAFSMCLMIFSTPAMATEPTWEEIKKLEIVYQSLSAVDAIQTIDCLNRNICYEANPIWGRYPSTEKIIGIKVVSGIIHYLLVKEIYERDPKAARTFQYVSIGVQGTIVAANMRIAF
jgi:hypothetical protein